VVPFWAEAKAARPNVVANTRAAMVRWKETKGDDFLLEILHCLPVYIGHTVSTHIQPPHCPRQSPQTLGNTAE